MVYIEMNERRLLSMCVWAEGHGDTAVFFIEQRCCAAGPLLCSNLLKSLGERALSTAN